MTPPCLPSYPPEVILQVYHSVVVENLIAVAVIVAIVILVTNLK